MRIAQPEVEGYGERLADPLLQNLAAFLVERQVDAITLENAFGFQCASPSTSTPFRGEGRC